MRTRRLLVHYDIDGDGVVTRAEVVQAETQRVRLEARKDAKVTQDELSIGSRRQDNWRKYVPT